MIDGQTGKQLMTPEEVGILLRVKTQTVYSWVRRGKLPSIKIAGSIRFDKKAIDALIESKKGGPQS